MPVMIVACAESIMLIGSGTATITVEHWSFTVAEPIAENRSHRSVLRTCSQKREKRRTAVEQANHLTRCFTSLLAFVDCVTNLKLTTFVSGVCDSSCLYRGMPYTGHLYLVTIADLEAAQSILEWLL